MSTLLALDNLSKIFCKEDGKDFYALKDLNLNIGSEHHLISLIGPDGSGKSTLLKIIAGLNEPDEGRISLYLNNETNNSPIGYMSQNLGLYEDLSVGVNLKLFCQLRDFNLSSLQDKFQANSEEEAFDAYLDDLLTQVGLIKFKDYKADSLSGGMKQKLALTCAISARPQLLLLDEPTVGVDPISRRELWDIINNYLKSTGSYCIFSSLYLEEAEKGSLTIFIKNGQLLYNGNAQELKDEVQEQCFALNLKAGISYQQAARNMMCNLHHSKEIIDLCPRMGRIDLLTKGPCSLEKLKNDLIKLFYHCQEPFNKMSPESFSLEKRCPILEDSYINLTSEQSLLNQEHPSSDHSLSQEHPYTGSSSEHTFDQGQSPSPVAGQDSDQALKQDYWQGQELNKEQDEPYDIELDFAPDMRHQKDAENSLPIICPKTGQEIVIRVEGIKKQFGDFTAVHDSNFDVYKGEIFGLLGPNGAGKTTTFRMICSLLNPSAGTILINNMELKNAKSSVRATIGYVAQKFCLYRKLTAKQNLEYFGQSYGLKGKELENRINSICKIFSLTPFLNDISATLPFGIQRSLSMACALIHRPTILFLDEATSGADPTSRRAFWSMIAKLAHQGTTVIVTTHFMEEAEYCDRFLIQDQGQILILGTPDEICKKENGRISIEEAFVNCVMQRRSQNK